MICKVIYWMLLFTYQTGGLMISMLWVFMGVVLMRGIACEALHLNGSMHNL